MFKSRPLPPHLIPPWSPPAYVALCDLERPLDRQLWPYLPRLCDGVGLTLAQCLQVPLHQRLPFPLVLESGAVHAGPSGGIVVPRGPWSNLQTEGGDVLDLNVQIEAIGTQASLALPLHFPLVPELGRAERELRVEETIKNSLWFWQNHRRRQVGVYAAVPVQEQGWMEQAVSAYREKDFAGYALMDLETLSLQGLLERVRWLSEHGDGKPLMACRVEDPGWFDPLWESGVQTVTSHAHLTLAREGKVWHEGRGVDLPGVSSLDQAIRNLLCFTRKPTTLAAVVKYSFRNLL